MFIVPIHRNPTTAIYLRKAMSVRVVRTEIGLEKESVNNFKMVFAITVTITENIDFVKIVFG